MRKPNFNPLVRLVDDDNDYRGSQKLFLQRLGWDVRDYASAADFLADDDPERPGCLVLDIRMPEMNGLDLQRKLAARSDVLPIIFLTGHGDVTTAVHAMKYGASDFIEKNGSPMALRAAVRKAVSLSLSQTQQKRDDAERLALFHSLTPREKDVILAACQGASNKDIAERFGIGLTTVKMHRSNGLAKLGVQNALEAFHKLDGLDLFGKRTSDMKPLTPSEP